MDFENIDEFEKDCKKLFKKYQSLPEDLALIRKVLSVFPLGRGNTDQISGLRMQSKIFKTRLMCRSVRSKTFRLIYCYCEQEQKITFIELYFKGDKENEDRNRILKNFD
jgi:mRNA-degrading endonuclease RelE of RelBE toxin-antitoxin system